MVDESGEVSVVGCIDGESLIGVAQLDGEEERLVGASGCLLLFNQVAEALLDDGSWKMKGRVSVRLTIISYLC